jgi:hypothetical protein
MKKTAFPRPLVAAITLSLLASPLLGEEPKAQVAQPQVAKQESVLKVKTPTKLSAANRAGLCGQTIEFEGVLTDGAGHPLGGKTLVFDAPGLFHDSKETDAQGHAKRPYVVGDYRKADGYPFSVSFGGDATYAGSKASATFLLAKSKTKIVIGDVSLVYNEGKNPGPGVPVVAIHLERDYDGKKISGNVEVRINGALVNTVSEPLTNIVPPGNGPWNFVCSFDATTSDSYSSTSASRTLHR